MNVATFVKILNSDFYTGVPDSLLKPLCNYLMSTYGIDGKHHIVAANEGNCVGIAAGYNIATQKIPVVYLQNSGEGNILNPVASLTNEKVYAIPMIFVIGWRGEPGVKDEPQHIFQGEITIPILQVLDIKAFIIDSNTTEQELQNNMIQAHSLFKIGKSVAFVIKKGALEDSKKIEYRNTYILNREQVIEHIVNVSNTDPIVSTTGKISRELFEIRERKGQSHEFDFLTVGSMGHCSSIALGIALQKTDKRIWCIDGDGALLMHMGAMSVISYLKPNNFIHIVINNNAHETVGGIPTVSNSINLERLALDIGYDNSYSVNSYEELDDTLFKVKNDNKLTFIEVKCALGSRKDLGRPTTTAIHNKLVFQETLLPKS